MLRCGNLYLAVLVCFLYSVVSSPSCGRCDKAHCDLTDLTTLKLCSYCPQPQYQIQTSRSTTLCECSNDESVKCFATRNLESIFDLMVNGLHHQYRYFKQIEIQDCNSDEISTNFFSGLKFQTVQIRDCPKLKFFSAHAFSSTADFLETLDLALSTSSDDIWSKVFEGLSYLFVLKRLKLTGFDNLIIPAKAFQSSSSSPLILTDIHFNDGIGIVLYYENINGNVFLHF